jgi:hypothetical protein
VEDVKRTAPEDWHAWAIQVLAFSKTNTNEMPRSQWPEFAKRIAADPSGNWCLIVPHDAASEEPYVCLVSPGGFQTIGVDFGSAAFAETNNPNASYKIFKIHPGVYVRRTM